MLIKMRVLASLQIISLLRGVVPRTGKRLNLLSYFYHPRLIDRSMGGLSLNRYPDLNIKPNLNI